MASFTLSLLAIDKDICACTKCEQAVWQTLSSTRGEVKDYELFDFPSPVGENLCCWCQVMHMFIVTPRDICDMCQTPDSFSKFIDSAIGAIDSSK